MADDITQQLLQQQSLINASMSGNGKNGGHILGIIPMDWNASGPFAMQSLSPVGKPIPGLFKDPEAMGGLAGKFFKALASIPADLKERAAKAGVMYEGELPSGSFPSGGGGSFASMVGGSRGGDTEIG